MKRLILLLPFCFLLLGCPVYDPPNGEIKIHNSSKNAIYVCSECSDTLSLSNPLRLFIINDNSYDEQGKKMTDTIFPRYKINRDSTGLIGVWGTPTKPQLFCNDKKIRLFFINERVMKEKEWAEICKFDLYEKKLVLTQSELEKMNWEITYRP